MNQSLSFSPGVATGLSAGTEIFYRYILQETISLSTPGVHGRRGWFATDDSEEQARPGGSQQRDV